MISKKQVLIFIYLLNSKIKSKYVQYSAHTASSITLVKLGEDKDTDLEKLIRTLFKIKFKCKLSSILISDKVVKLQFMAG